MPINLTDIDRLALKFSDIFSHAPRMLGFSPGRVNLIGEHTDYNGGYVLPTALDLGISIAMHPRDDNLVRIFSDKFGDMTTRTLAESARDDWSDYALGAIIFAQKSGLMQSGADIAISTTLPSGSGLSSSAALTVGLLTLADTEDTLTPTQIAVLARRVENEFIGIPCGIMDQMAVAIARPGQALALNTKSLTYDVIDLPLTHKMVVIHSGQHRRLAEGRYQVRKEECDAVKAALGHDDLCLMTDKEFEALSTLEPTLRARARHCMTEHRRTLLAKDALASKDMKHFGALMNESHVSMRDDFDISLPAIDALVADAVEFGALGARLTGGGFGGCIVACLEMSTISAWTKKLLGAHDAAFFVC